MLKSEQLSRYRQSIRKLAKRIEYLADRAVFSDPLIHGSPAEVFRKCGRKGCKCGVDPKSRHGPYKVIQIFQQGRQRQVCLRRDQEGLWKLARHYQYQVEKFSELKATCLEIQSVMWEVIEKRIQEFPKKEK